MEDITEENPDMAEREAMLADDAVPVCPNCLEPCNPLDNYCPSCGSNEAINPLTPYLPFVNIRFQVGILGKLWHKCWIRQTHLALRCFYLFFFLLYYPLFLLIVLPFIVYDKLKTKDETMIQRDSS